MTPRPDTPRGIGGSLLVFLIACAVVVAVALSDLIGIWQAHVYFEQKFGHPLSFGFIGFVWVLSGARVLAPLAVIIMMLLARRRMVLGVVISVLWLAFVVLPAINVLRMLTDPFLVPGWMSAVFWPLGYGLAFCIAATAYLLTSRRVAATYARHVDLDQVFD
jgi:hypothetical protein